MSVKKLFIYLSQQQYEFVNSYKTDHHFKTCSEVISEALYLLQQAQLESCYRAASKEIDNVFEITNLDGLEDET